MNKQNSLLDLNKQNLFKVGGGKVGVKCFQQRNKDLVLIYLMYNEYNQSTVKTQPFVNCSPIKQQT